MLNNSLNSPAILNSSESLTRKRQSSQSQGTLLSLPKMPKKRSSSINPLFATTTTTNSSAAYQQQQEALMDGFITETPSSDAATLPSGLSNPSFNVGIANHGSVNSAGNPVSTGSTSLAETLQSCYTNILNLEKKNQHYNVILNQAIFRLGQQVRQVISAITEEENAVANGEPISPRIPDCFELNLGPNGELPPNLRTRELRSDHYRQLLGQRHSTIQKTLALAYQNSLELLDAYYDFILYSLRGGSSATDGGALSSSSNSKSINNIFSGYQVLQVYKISRRLWIYGIINLLENMKNIIGVVMAMPPSFQDLSQAKGNAKQAKIHMTHVDNELCINFISHCFSLLSTLVEMNNNLTIEVDSDPNSLTRNYENSPSSIDGHESSDKQDRNKVLTTVSLITDFQNWWYEKIADLSRMSIALYPSSGIDWEASAEHWYLKAVSGNHGHGKTYYHLATVQQPSSPSDKNGGTQGLLGGAGDTNSIYGGASTPNTSSGNDISLEALFNLGKSVFVKDCFVPTGHYLRMVLDSMFANSKISSYGLYESAIVHLTCGNGTILIDKNKVAAADNLSNWELIILLYIRISKILLVSNFNSSPELVKIVSNFARSFGSIDFISGEDFPAFNEYSNPGANHLANTPSATTPITSINPLTSMGSPMSLDPFGNTQGLLNGLDGSNNFWVPPSQNNYAHHAIRVSFFEKESANIGSPALNSTTKAMLIEKPSIKLLNFWFNKSGNLASINIWQFVGFGVLNFKNLFSILFELPIALKERQERKETKKNRKSSTASLGEGAEAEEPQVSTIPQITTAELDSLLNDPYPVANEMTAFKWYESLQFINKSALELSFRMLKKFLNCPFKSVSTPHIIVWLYFLISVGKAIDKNPSCEPVVLGLVFKRFFPWDSLVNYLNFWVNEARECFDFDDLEKGFNIMEGADKSEFMFQQNLILQIQDLFSLGNEGFLKFFNENETLIEVWKLWGCLWFDSITEKKNYLNLRYAGWKGKDFLSDYINKNEELLYILKPDLNFQDNIQRSHNTNNNYFRDLFSEGDNCDRTNHKINSELYEKEVRFQREQDFKNGTFDSNKKPPEKNDRRLFNSVEKERIKRILLLGIYIAQTYPQIGLRLTDRLFKLDPSVSNGFNETSLNQRAGSENDAVKNQLTFDFITDNRFSNLAENISENNILRESDREFDIKLFFRSKSNYSHIMKNIQMQRTTRQFDVEDDKSMANSDYSKLDLPISFVNHDIDSSVMDEEAESLLNYDLARKAFGIDDENEAQDLTMTTASLLEKQSLNIEEPDHLISPNIQLGVDKISPFDSVQPTPVIDGAQGIELPYVKFVGNIASDIDSSISYFTFDTNSWLKNCGKIYKIFKNCTLNDNVKLKLKIALPLVVYQELRSLRKSGDSFLSDSATRCVITIKNLYTDHMAYFKKDNNPTMKSAHLLLLRPDGKITMNLHESCDIGDQNLTFKAIDDSILGAVSNSAKFFRQNYFATLKEEYNGNVNRKSYLEFDGGTKKINGVDLHNFKFNILISDTRPLRLKSRSVNVNAYQCKWLFYNLEKINLEGACLD